MKKILKQTLLPVAMLLTCATLNAMHSISTDEKKSAPLAVHREEQRARDDEIKKTITRISTAFEEMVTAGVFTEAAEEHRAILAKEWRTGSKKCFLQVAIDYIELPAVAYFALFLTKEGRE